jgi:drug/metabolite transporter (DMT)-like permease
MVDLGKIERKIDKGVSIVWFGAIFGGLVILVVGLLWFMDTQNWISVDIWTICSVLLIMAGVGVICFALWLRSLLRF